MIVDCDSCAMRDVACSDCVVGVLLGMPAPRSRDDPVELDAAERAAIGVLADSGLVPPLRLVATGSGPAGDRADERAGSPARGSARDGATYDEGHGGGSTRAG